MSRRRIYNEFIIVNIFNSKECNKYFWKHRIVQLLLTVKIPHNVRGLSQAHLCTDTMRNPHWRRPSREIIFISRLIIFIRSLYIPSYNNFYFMNDIIQYDTCSFISGWILICWLEITKINICVLNKCFYIDSFVIVHLLLIVLYIR